MIYLQNFQPPMVSCCDYSLHIEAAGEQGAESKGEELQVLPNHACDAICRRNSLLTHLGQSGIKEIF
ncbi:hypothetical protein [Nostoc sp.]|uniref:hypothetical protein n=1 Tax=Nostoc sp. TaxID=1180 RepID=UPI002FFC8923